MTSFGINNEGQLVLDYYHEDTDLLAGANVYNGQNSVLWCNFREAFPDKIKETYQDLRSNSILNYDELVDHFITNGSDKWSESIYNEDADFKYISMLQSDNDASNLGQVRGTGEEHFRYFVGNRLPYCDGKWYAGDYPDDYVSLRIYTPATWSGVEPNADITVIPYSHMYTGVRYKANGTLYQQRAEANEEVTFEAPDETFNDTETAVYGASHLSSLGDLSPLYCGSINVAKATKLTELIIGSNAEGYTNPNLNELSIGTNNLLKIVNIRNCINLTDPLGLSECPNIEEIYAGGSGITGVELPDSGYLKTVELPATIANLTFKNQAYIETLTIEGYDAIKTIQIENCPTIPSLDILSNSPNVERARLTNVNWSYSDATALYELIERDIAGIDENGTNTDSMWVDGTCHINTLTGTELSAIKSAFPYLTITYDSLSSQLTYMNYDGTETLGTQTIQNGGDGSYTGDAPTRESTAQYNFAFAGWTLTPGGDADENALKNVEADRTVYAAFSKELRSYTVSFYNGTTLEHSETVAYGSDATYSGTPTPEADYLEFVGWSPAPTNITGDLNCYAQWYDTREITDDWDTIATACLDGTATSKYAVGAYKPLNIGTIPLPYDFYMGGSVVFNNEIHLLGGLGGSNKHYKLNGTEWAEVSTLPYKFYTGGAVVYNDEIHVLGGNGGSTSHYKWDGSTWTEVSTLPYKFYAGGIIVYNDEIHILGGHDSSSQTSHYKWDGTEWSEVSTLPYVFYYGTAVIYNNQIHILGTNANTIMKNHYKWNGTSWTEDIALYNDYCSGAAVVYDNSIYVLGGNPGNNGFRYLRFDGSSWTKSDLPYKAVLSCAVVYNNQIHILGSNATSVTRRAHYHFDGSSWTEFGTTETITMEIAAHNHDELADGTRKWEKVGDLPNIFAGAPAVIFNDEIHVLGGNGGSTSHYKWDGTEWTVVSTLPLSNPPSVVWNNMIYISTGSSIYAWNGTEWTEVTTTPYASPHTLIVFNDELHVLGAASGDSKKHYKWDGSTWTEVSTLPMQHYNLCPVVVYDGAMHLLGSPATNYTTKHYKWDGSAWTEVSTLPAKFIYAHGLVYENAIHVITDKYHYKWDGVEWTELENNIVYIQVGNTRTPVVLHNNEIHILGGGSTAILQKSHFKWSGPSWESASTLPYGLYKGYSVVYNNELHILGGNGGTTSHYKWDGTKWTSVSTLPITCTASFTAIVYDNTLHICGGLYGKTYHYTWNGTEWTEASTLPFPAASSAPVIYNNELHLVGSGKSEYYTVHYKWDGTEWTSVSTLPSEFRTCGDTLNACVYNEQIHFFAGRLHYKWDGTEWTSVSTLPCSFNAGHLAVYNNEIHLCGGNTDESTYYKHYKWDGNEWAELSNLSVKCVWGSVIVFRNKLHILGDEYASSYTKSHMCYTNPRASLTFIAKNLLAESRVMNSTNVGTRANYLNTELKEYVANTLFHAFPDSLQSNIKDVIKLSHGNGVGLQKHSERCWIPSDEEVGCSTNYMGVDGEGDVYPIFTDNESRKRSKVEDSSTIRWWTRSVYTGNINRFRLVKEDGSITGTTADESTTAQGVCFGFCL